MLKAIETRYKGYRFRSRLEARWAVFFDALSMPWEYEKEGYDLGDRGWYLPDFYVTKHGRSYAQESATYWAEVKPQALTLPERMKCNALVRLTKIPCLVLVGTPDFRMYEIIDEWSVDCPGDANNEVLLHSSKNRIWYSPSDCDLESYVVNDSEYQHAVTMARSARFEHGEHGHG